MLYVYGGDAEWGHFRVITASYFWDRLVTHSCNALCHVCRAGTVLGFGAVEGNFMSVCSVWHWACSLFCAALFFVAYFTTPQCLRLYLCRVILRGTVIDENSKWFEKNGHGVIEVLFWHLPGGTEEGHEKLQLEWSGRQLSWLSSRIKA